MPRRSGGGRPAPARPSTPSRPTAPPANRPQVPQQIRPASTLAGQPGTQQAKPPAQAGQSQGPGLFGQMASTAAGVAVGSSIGHAIGGFFGGGSSSAEATDPNANAVAQPADNSNYAANSQYGPRSCENDAKMFTQCLDQNQGNMQICGWYLEQLKACQSAASQY